MSIPLNSGKAAVGASCGSEDPFEEESQENQLNTWRADIREHGANGGAPPSGPAGNLQLTPGSPVADKSAVGGEGTKAHLQSREEVQGKDIDMKWQLGRDIGKCSMNKVEQEQFGAFPVFRDGSPLWTAVAQETRERKSVTGSGNLSGEPVFCMLNVFFGEDLEASLLRHNNAWTNGMKEWLVQDPTHWKQLLADVPGRPASTNLGRPSASAAVLTPSPQNDMKGMMSKYNCQYRRPSPHNLTMLDSWTKSLMTNISPAVLKCFLSELFNVASDELLHTYVRDMPGVDWTAWNAAPSSMLVPVFSPHSSTSAVGEEQYICRSVTTTNFPAFCYLLGEWFTAAEIEKAWLQLPLVKPGKRSRGSSGGRKSKWKQVWATQ